jgi:uroporphyrinogen-III synthase
VDELVLGDVDAVAFTTQVQVRNLFQIAERTGGEARLASALNERVVVAAVGPTCADALRAHGVEPDVEPVHPKMGQMVVALARHWEAFGGKAPR